MLKSGTYNCDVVKHYVERDFPVGNIRVKLNVSPKGNMSMTLIENNVKWDAPQIDDMFYGRSRVTIGNETKHAVAEWSDGSFTLYPYRVGVPYVFEREA